MNKKIILSIALASLTSFSAQALPLSPYLGADYIQSNTRYNHEYRKFAPQDFASGAAVAGIKILPGISVEGFYQTSTDSDKSSGNVVQAGDTTFTNMKIRSYGADLVTDILHLNKVELMSSIGVGKYEISIDSKRKAYSDYYNGSTTWNGTGLRMGIGAQINFTEHLSARAMGRYILTDMENLKDIKEISFGLRYYLW